MDKASKTVGDLEINDPLWFPTRGEIAECIIIKIEKSSEGVRVGTNCTLGVFSNCIYCNSTSTQIDYKNPLLEKDDKRTAFINKKDAIDYVNNAILKDSFDILSKSQKAYSNAIELVTKVFDELHVLNNRIEGLSDYIVASTKIKKIEEEVLPDQVRLTTVSEWINTHECSTRLINILKAADDHGVKYISDIDKESFLSFRHAGKHTWREFSELRGIVD